MQRTVGSTRFDYQEFGASLLLECLVYPIALFAALLSDLVTHDSVTPTAKFSERHIDETSTVTRAWFANERPHLSATNSAFTLLARDGD